MLFAFDSEAHLRDWIDSSQRQRCLLAIAELTHGDAATRVLTGLETWFALPSAPTQTPPPRWKMALITWIGIFALVLATSNTIAPALARVVAMPLTILIVTSLITSAMTWLFIPTLARLFARWLYPQLTSGDHARSETEKQ